MSRKPRNLQSGYSYHITIRCNNREFKLQKRECREAGSVSLCHQEGFEQIQV
jgi:REP element-mobilizing transposase RayT